MRWFLPPVPSGKAQSLEAFDKDEGRKLQRIKQVCGRGGGIWMEERDGK